MAMFSLLISSHVVSSYVTSHSAVPSRRQMKWLKEMTVTLCESQPGCLSPQQISSSHDLMYAWSHTKACSKENALAVESLLKRVIDERVAGNNDADITIDDYNCLLEGWARAHQGPAAAERCESILYKMHEHGPAPNLSSFKAVLMAWRHAQSSTSFAPHRTQRILDWMIRLSEDNPQILPDADCFDIVLQTWSRSGHESAPQNAEHVLGMMERLYERIESPKLKPRTTSFNAVLYAWTKSNDAKAADRASDILTFMELLETRGDKQCGPDKASYNIVMTALTKSQDKLLAARKADAFLQHAETGHYAGKTELAPDTLLFNSAMGCWSKTNVPGAYKKTRNILDRQIRLHASRQCDQCKPDVYGFTTVLASCAAESGNNEEKDKAFNVAIRTFSELKNSDEGPNHVSYGTMLKACAKLLPNPIRQQWASAIFEDCCENGYVGEMAIKRFREAASSGYRLTQGAKHGNLPTAWTRNVFENKNEHRVKKSVHYRKRAEV
jgi:hypothetical protein